MKKLTENIYIDADENSFILYEKRVNRKEDSKNYGKEYFLAFSYHSTFEQVSKKLSDLGLRQFLDKDWLRCVQFIEESHANFLKGVEELKKKRYGKVV